MNKLYFILVVVFVVDCISIFFVIGGIDGIIKVWDIVGGYFIYIFCGFFVFVLVFCFFEVVGCLDEFFYFKGKRGLKVMDEGDEFSEIIVNYRFVFGSQDGKVKVWDLNKCKCVVNFDFYVLDVQVIDYLLE